MRAGNQIAAQTTAVVLDLQVAHGDRRHVDAQRLPMIAVVERHPHLRVGGAVQQPLHLRIFTDGIGRCIARQSGADLGPGGAAVVRAIKVRTQIVEAERVRRDVGRTGVEMAGVDVVDARPRLERTWRHVFPRGAAVGRDLHLSVVGTGPEYARTAGRRRQRGNRSGRGRCHGVAVLAGGDGHFPCLPCEIGADTRPALAAVERFPHHVRCVVQHVGIYRREVQRHRAYVAAEVFAVRAAHGEVGAHEYRLSGATVVLRHVGALAAEHHIGIARIRRRDAVFLNVDRMPVVQRDTTIVGAAVHACRAGVLLTAAYAIRECVVGRHVIHRGGGLRVPIAPRRAAVARYDRALIGHGENEIGIVRIHPDLLIVVTTRRPAHGRPGESAVFRAPHDRGRAVHHVLVARVHGNRGQIAPADACQRTVIHQLRRSAHRRSRTIHGEIPMLAGIGGLVKTDWSGCAGGRPSRRRRGDHGVQHLGVARRERDVRLQHRGQSYRELLPRGAAVDRLEYAVAAATEPLSFDEALLLLPERRVHDVGILRIDAHIVGARVLVLVQDALKRCTTIERPEHAALRVGSVRMAKGGDKQPVGILRVDIDHRDHLRFAEAQMRPRCPVIHRLVNAIADREIWTDDPGATAHVDDVRVRWGDRDRTDRTCGLVVEQRHPVRAVVGAAPHAAVVEAGVEHARLRGHAG